MNIRFVNKTVHAFLDYRVALSLVAAPFLLGVGSGNPLALWVSVATGVAAFLRHPCAALLAPCCG